MLNSKMYLKRNDIGIPLEKLGNYFIYKHSKYLDIENYSMDFVEEIDPELVSDGDFKLAFICEIINSFSDKNKAVSFISPKKIKKTFLYPLRNLFT